jgi:hypothetical protein
MGPDGTQNQEWLCWRGPVAIYPTDRPTGPRERRETEKYRGGPRGARK